MSVACLPWYALPETKSAQDALWSVVARNLARAGVNAPAMLSREVPIPGVFCHPDLLLAQCCGYDIVYGFAASLRLLGTPCYAAPGCVGPTYRSFVLVRAECRATALEELRGGTCAINNFNSHSGTNALRQLVAPIARHGRFFNVVKVTGAHLRSLDLVLSGEADVMAMDCILHALLVRHRPAVLAGTRILAQTMTAPAPPFVISAAIGSEGRARVRDALFLAFSDAATAEARAALLVDRIEALSLADYVGIVEIEAKALRHSYFELHAPSPARSDV